MREIRVYPLPSLKNDLFVEDSVAVVIDVLRATTSIVSAVAAGVKEVVPLLDIEEARKIKAQEPSVLLGGERHGVKIDGFDFGNSPQSFTPETIGGKTLIFTTTNGTVAMHAARKAKTILLASFLNAGAVVKELSNENRIAIFCAGTDGVETEEDLLLAGYLSTELRHPDIRTRPDYRFDEEKLVGLLRKSRGGQNLIELGLDADIEFAARINSIDCVPKLDPGTMRITPTSAPCG